MDAATRKVIKVTARVAAGVLLLAITWFVFVTVNNARHGSRISGVTEMLKLNHRAVMIYAADNDDRMPGQNWSEVTKKYQERDPDGREELAPVAMFPDMLHARLEDLGSTEVMLVEYAGGTHGDIATDPSNIRSSVISGESVLAILVGGVVKSFEIGKIR